MHPKKACPSFRFCSFLPGKSCIHFDLRVKDCGHVIGCDIRSRGEIIPCDFVAKPTVASREVNRARDRTVILIVRTEKAVGSQLGKLIETPT